MAESPEVFRGTIDGSGDGVAIDSKSQGDASSGNSQAALAAEDQSNLLDYLQTQDEDGAVPIKAQAVMTVKDEDGGLQYIPQVDGRIAVTTETPGTQISNTSIDAAVKGSDTDGVSIALTPTKVYDEIEMVVSSSKPVTWKLTQIDDVTTTVRASVFTGSGSFSFSKLFKNLKITAGASGTQTLKITGNQLTGSGSNSDMHTYLGVVQGF